MSTSSEDKPGRARDFEAGAVGRRASGPIGEFWYFIKRTRNWWLAPIILFLLMVGGLLFLSGTAIAPLIYTLF